MKLKRRAVACGIMGLAAVGLGASSSFAEPKQDQQPLEAARKEGQVTWASGVLNQPICDSIGAAFTQKFPGIRVNATKTTSEVAFQRLMQDINGGAVQSDVFTTTDASHVSYLAAKGKLVNFVPPNESGMVSALRHFDPQGFYHVSVVGLVALMYNTTKVKPDEAPKDWPDLTNPKWKNKIAFGSPNYSGLVAVWTVGMAEKYGWEFFDKLNQLDPLIGRSIDDAVAMLNSGERQVAICSPASAFRSMAKGNPLAVNYASSFTLADFSPSAILRGSPSPNAAKLFMNFLAGTEYSRILAENFEQSLRTDVPPPHGAKSLTELTLFQPKLEDIEKELPGLKNRWRDTFGA